MTVIVDIAQMRMRCPRCRAVSTVQSAIDVRPGFQYLTLRCMSCAIVFDAQVATAEGEEGLLLTDRRLAVPSA
jgi:phage FluMu protein Com